MSNYVKNTMFTPILSDLRFLVQKSKEKSIGNELKPPKISPAAAKG